MRLVALAFMLVKAWSRCGLIRNGLGISGYGGAGSIRISCTAKSEMKFKMRATRNFHCLLTYTCQNVAVFFIIVDTMEQNPKR